MDVTPLEDTNLSPDNKNLFKFSAASAINELVLRKRVINENVLLKVKSLKSDLVFKSQANKLGGGDQS